MLSHLSLGDRGLAAARVLALACLAVALGGCIAGNAGALFIAVLLAGASAGIAGCSTSHAREDGSVGDATPGTDGPTGDGGGTWESCCESGTISTCYCPPDTACNYGWYTNCGDGTCVDIGVCPGTDAGTDAGGANEPCCVGGTITTCFCPAGVECNYGWYTDCGAGTCVDLGTMCPTNLDAGPADAGGAWEPCCVDHAIDSCFCPAGVACNYGWYTDCGGGVCAYPGETCAAP